MKNSTIYNDDKGDYIRIDSTGYKSYIQWAGKRPKWVEIKDDKKSAIEPQGTDSLLYTHEDS